MQKIIPLCVLLILSAGNLYAQTKWYVKPAASGSGNGTSWANASASLQNIINQASAGDSVFVAGGTYQPGSGQSFAMKEGVKIYGGFAGTESNLSQRDLAANRAAGDSSVLKGNGKGVISNRDNGLTAAAVLNGFTITGGSNATHGGGMLNWNASPTISHCVFFNNQADAGGAMYNLQKATPDITHCVFAGNSAEYGGAILSSNQNILIGPRFSDCIFANNHADLDGGAMRNITNTVQVTNCIFTGNSAGRYGGGLYNDGPNSRFINCVFEGNNAITSGAGAFVIYYPAEFINCTFAKNTAISGSAITYDPYYDISFVMKIRNCVFWDNPVSAGSAILNYDGSAVQINIDRSYSQTALDGTTTSNTIINNVNPFVDVSNPKGTDGIWGTLDDGLHLNYGGGHFPSGKSPIDAGGNNHLPANILTDLTGADRKQDGTVDMGAYEGPSSRTWYVKTVATGNGSGRSWDNASASIQEVIDKATAGDSIFVAGGTYEPTFSESFRLKEGVKMYGGFAGTELNLSQRDLAANRAAGDSSVLKGNGNRPINNAYNNLTPAAVLDGFTITGGLTARKGGAMYNYNASPTISNCIFYNNRITDNTSGGGAIYNEHLSAPTFIHCRFIANVADGHGGAIYNQVEDHFTTPKFKNCIFSDNRAGGDGGVIYSINSSQLVTNSFFINNSAGHYGGVTYENNSVNLYENCVFSGNKADGNYGGVFYATDFAPLITGCTFSNNTAQNGSAVAYRSINGTAYTLNFRNNIIWNNPGASGSVYYNDGGTPNIRNTYSPDALAGTANIFGNVNPFVDDANPMGADGIWGTEDDGLHLNYTPGHFDAGKSPINAGNNLYVSSDVLTDIAGAARKLDGTVDLGAYEGQATSTLPVTLLHFSGQLRNGIAQLKWNTSDEINFSHFDLQKSTDGERYNSVATLTARGSNSSYAYSIPQAETLAYYRLKMVDIDGRYDYSPVRILSQTGNRNMSIYPNPANNYVNINYPQGGKAHIYDAGGRFVKVLVLRPGLNRVDISALKSGVYYVAMEDGSKARFIKTE